MTRPSTAVCHAEGIFHCPLHVDLRQTQAGHLSIPIPGTTDKCLLYRLACRSKRLRGNRGKMLLCGRPPEDVVRTSAGKPESRIRAMAIGRLESASGKPIGSKLPSHHAMLQIAKPHASITSHSFSRFPNRHRWWCSPLAARGKSPATFKRRCIPAELRCSSVEYVQYAPSSRLVSQAPRRSRCYTGFHHGLLAGARTPSG